MIKKLLKTGFVLMATLVPAIGFAAATTLDVSAATAQLEAMKTALVSVGGVIIAASAIAVSFKWVKGMIFG